MTKQCPSCGYCPHCGRSNFQPYRPYFQPYLPGWTPLTPYTTPFGGTTSGTTIPYNPPHTVQLGSKVNIN